MIAGWCDLTKAATDRIARQDKLFSEVAKVRKTPEDKWTPKDLRTMCKYKKQKGDGPLIAATRTNLPKLREQWEERKERPSPVKEKNTVEVPNMPLLDGADAPVAPGVSRGNSDDENAAVEQPQTAV